MKNKFKFQKNSLHSKIWEYFLLFSIFILGFLWIFQVLFFKQFYRYRKTKDIETVTKIIQRNKDSDELASIINQSSFDRSVCVEVVNEEAYTLYSSIFFGKGCITNKEDSLKYKKDFIRSGERKARYDLINPMFDNHTLVKAIKLDNKTFAFVNTSIDPIDGTTSLLQTQLIIVTIVILILSFIISYFISHHISFPIVKINRSAKKLAKGEFRTVFDAGEDILELRELADTLNYTRDELAKTEELRQDLMANVSHDLKTPLTMIKAYAEMGRDLHENHPIKRKEDMDIIMDEVDRLTILVDDILTLSSMQSEINELNIVEFDLVTLVEQILHRYHFLQETENYQFVFKHKKKKVLIRADKKKLEQVIYNLINNAINYTGSDNKVIITITTKNHLVKVSIRDTGKGIKEEDLPYIWDRYYKNSKKHKRNLVGTGLGLSIVKTILELHQYSYGVDSKKNKGTVFYFEIKKEDDAINCNL